MGILRKSKWLRRASALAVAAAFAAVLAAPVEARGISEGDWVNATGTVVDIGRDRFVIDTGAGRLRVDTGGWPNPPAYRLVRAGDVVSVEGRLERNLLWSPTLDADNITTYSGPRVSNDPFRQEMRRYLLGLVDPSYSGLRGAVRNNPQAVAPSGVAVSGVIKEMGPRHLELVGDSGTLKVDFGELIYESRGIAWLADLAEGDEISVQGRLDPDYVSNRTILAEDILVRN